jgi:DNA-binding NarL/FixJ family response regulator
MEVAKAKKIFLVDDDVMLTTALTDYLTRKIPHSIRSFQTGEECIQNLAENPDIVILDFYLNSVQKDAANGSEVLQVIKKSHPDTHIIMLSGQNRYGVALQTLQKGAEQYVIKDQDAFAKIEQLVNEISSS